MKDPLEEEVLGKCPSCSANVVRFDPVIVCENDHARACLLASVVTYGGDFGEWLEAAEAETNNAFLEVSKARREYEIALEKEAGF